MAIGIYCHIAIFYFICKYLQNEAVEKIPTIYIQKIKIKIKIMIKKYWQLIQKYYNRECKHKETFTKKVVVKRGTKKWKKK
jgi:hypothetical protein